VIQIYDARNVATNESGHGTVGVLQLLNQVHRAATQDQLKALEWLLSKFPEQAIKLQKGLGRSV
jgi:hypothetical protein